MLGKNSFTGRNSLRKIINMVESFSLQIYLSKMLYYSYPVRNYKFDEPQCNINLIQRGRLRFNHAMCLFYSGHYGLYGRFQCMQKFNFFFKFKFKYLLLHTYIINYIQMQHALSKLMFLRQIHKQIMAILRIHFFLSKPTQKDKCLFRKYKHNT